jgi:hypothetical protein
VLETEAADSPRRVVQALQHHGTDDRLKAILVLGDMVEQEFGAEQANVLRALLQSIALVDDDDLIGIAETIADRVVMALSDNEDVTETHYQSVLRLGVAANRPMLTTAALGVPDALSTVGLSEVLPYYESLVTADRGRVRAAIAHSLEETDDVLAAGLRELAGDAVREVLDSDDVKRALRARLGDESGPSTAAALYDALDSSSPDPDLVAGIQREFLLLERPYPAVLARAEWSDSIITDRAVRTEHALLALDWSAAEDWPLWSSWIDGPAPEDHPDFARFASDRVLQIGASADERTRRDAEQLLRRLAPYVEQLGENDVAKTIEIVASLLDPQDWWMDRNSCEQQEQLHRLVRAVARDGTPMGDAVRDRLLDDLRRPLAAGAVNVQTGTTISVVEAALTAQTLQGIRQMGPSLGSARAASLYTAWSQLNGAALLLLTRLRLAGAAVSDEKALEPPRPVAADLQRYVGVGRPFRDSLVSAWLTLWPSLDEVLELVPNYTQPGVAATQAIDDWMERLDQAERTKFVVALVENGRRARGWLRPARRHGIDELAVMRAIDARVRTLSRHEDREVLVDFVEALEPSSQSAQRIIADLTLWMLRRRVKIDLRIALRLVRSLQPGFGAARTLADEFKAAADALDSPIPSGSAQDLKRVGIRLPKRSLTESARRRLERATKRR